MFPIPDPSRLLPRKLTPQHGPAPGSSPAKKLITLGGCGIFLACAIGGGALANAFSSWLIIPGVLLGIGIGLGLNEISPIFLGIIEAIFYFCITYVFSDGLERPDPTYSWIYSGIMTGAFLWATFSVWKNRRSLK